MAVDAIHTVASTKNAGATSFRVIRHLHDEPGAMPASGG
jgi:hypothetical protein